MVLRFENPNSGILISTRSTNSLFLFGNNNIFTTIINRLDQSNDASGDTVKMIRRCNDEGLIKIEVLKKEHEEVSKSQEKKIYSQEKKIHTLGVELAKTRAELASLHYQLSVANQELQQTRVIMESNQESFRKIVTQVRWNKEISSILNQKVLGQAQNQRMSNREVSISSTSPRFFGNNTDIHPKDFLQNLDEFFRSQDILDAQKIFIVNNFLKYAAADWYLTVMYRIIDYNNFKQLFLDEYWSKNIQLTTLGQCLAVDQIPDNQSYYDHFATWFHKLKHIDFRYITEAEIINTIAYHYPRNVKAMILTIPEKTKSAVYKLLVEEEQRRHSLVREDEILEILTTYNENSMEQFEDKASLPVIKEDIEKIVQETVQLEKPHKEIWTEASKLLETIGAKISHAALRKMLFKRHCLIKRLARRNAGI